MPPTRFARDVAVIQARRERKKRLQTAIGHIFPGHVFILPQNAAGEYAHQEYVEHWNEGRMAFWTDGSSHIMRATNDNTYYCAGAAVVFKQSRTDSTYIERKVSFKHSDEKHQDVELIAIALALDEALKEHVRRKLEKLPSLHTIVVYSDAAAELERIQNFASYNRKRQSKQIHHMKIMQRILSHSLDLHSLGIKVELTYVPGHSGVQGNERADFVASRTATSDSIRPTFHKNCVDEDRFRLAERSPRGVSQRCRRRAKNIKQGIVLSTTRQATKGNHKSTATRQKILFAD